MLFSREFYKAAIEEQEALKNYLEYYSKNPLPNVIIFDGQNRQLKYFVAIHILAKHHLCENRNACGKCSSCRLLEKNEHPDFILFPEDKIKIGDPDEPEPYSVRWLVKTKLAYKPSLSSVRIVVFPAAEEIGNEAEAAILKTLEEPSTNTKFFLFTPSLVFLKETIISRSIVIPLKSFGKNRLKKLSGYDDEEFLEILGGTLDYPLQETYELYRDVKEKVQLSFQHPVHLLELESHIENMSKNNRVFKENEFLEFFSLIVLQVASRKRRWDIMDSVFQFLAGIRSEQQGLESYFLSRFFHQLSLKIHH